MNLKEKVLYHQIHPVKLLTDISTAVFTLYLLWRHYLISAIFVAIIPSIIVTLIIIGTVELEKYKESAFGRYIKKYMTRAMELVRFAGYAVMAVGAWYHIAWMVPFGFSIILFGWLRGAVSPERSVA
jgi:hypothetical protein